MDEKARLLAVGILLIVAVAAAVVFILPYFQGGGGGGVPSGWEAYSGNASGELVVNASRSTGPVTDALRGGIMTAFWEDPTLPVARELDRSGKTIVWRLHIGLWGLENYENKPASEQEWKAFENEARRNCELAKEKFPGKIVFSIGTYVPRWLSAHPNETEQFGDAPWNIRWRNSAPDNYTKWAEIISRIARVNKECGIGADYIILDEPDWMFYGSEEEVFETYKYAALAIKEADPDAKVGALGVSGWGSKKSNIPGSLDWFDTPYNHTLIEGFIGYIGKNLGVPVDFIDWHFSGPAEIENQVNQTRNWMDEANWSEEKKKSVFFTVGEGVYSADKDYECSEKAASFLVAQYIAFANAGIARYTATSLYDQSGWISGQWQHVGFFSGEGIIKPKWNAMKLLNNLQGERLEVSEQMDSYALERGIYSAASKNGNRLDVLVSFHPGGPLDGVGQCVKAKNHTADEVPEDVRRQIAGGISAIFPVPLEGMEFSEYSMIFDRLSAAVDKTNLSGQLKADVKACLEEAKTGALGLYKVQKIDIKITDLVPGTYNARIYLVDANHSNSYRYDERTGEINKTLGWYVESAKNKQVAEIEGYLRQRHYSGRDIALLMGVAENCQKRYGNSTNASRVIACGIAFIEANYTTLDRYSSYGGTLDSIRKELGAAVEAGRNAFENSLRGSDFYQKMDEINRMNGVALEKIVDKTVTVSNGAYVEEAILQPYSVALVELEKQ